MRALPLLALALACAQMGLGQEVNPEALFREAQQAQQSGDYSAAAEKYQQLTVMHPELVSAHANLGIVLAALQRYDEAIAQYYIALTHTPDDPRLRLNLGLAYFKKVDFARAAAQFSSLHKENPGDARVATLLGTCELELGQTGEALKLLKPLEAANSDNMDLEWALGTAFVRAGQALEGVKRIHKVAEQGQNAGAYQVAANIYLDLTLLGFTFSKEAEADAETVLRLQPDSPKAYIVLGIIDDLAGEARKAAEHYESALKIDPDDLHARIQLAGALYRDRQYLEAKDQLHRILSTDPNAYDARYVLVQIHQAEGNLQQAVKELETLTKQDPQWIEPHVQLSVLYYKMKKPDAGEREKKIVDQLREDEQRRTAAAHLVGPRVSPNIAIPAVLPANPPTPQQ